jgi:hypothetical protein
MKMWWGMIAPKHLNNDSIKDTYCWHLTAYPSFSKLMFSIGYRENYFKNGF